MTDRELIGLSAKAIGEKEYPPSWKGDHKRFTAEGFSGWFNPLEFKDQPLALAALLDIDISFDYETETVSALWADRRGNPGRLQDVLSICYQGRNKLECTARVVVSAAAEIGKAMQEKK